MSRGTPANTRDPSPASHVSRLSVFVLRDRNMNVDLSIERHNELTGAGHANCSYRLLPEYDHQLDGIKVKVVDPGVA